MKKDEKKSKIKKKEEKLKFRESINMEKVEN